MSKRFRGLDPLAKKLDLTALKAVFAGDDPQNTSPSPAPAPPTTCCSPITNEPTENLYKV